MANTADLVKQWAPILDKEGYEPIKDAHKRAVTAQLLENQAGNKSKEIITEAGEPTNVTANIDKFDPILIKLVRRMAPKLIAYDVCGVQALSGPSGLIFAMKAHYGDQGAEALHNEADTSYGGAGTHTGTDPFDPAYSTGVGLSTAVAEGNTWNEMSFSIEKTSVSVSSHQLKATYSMELADDMKFVHGLDAESELTNILSTELISEQNRTILRNIYSIAKPGAQFATTPGIFDLSTDSAGRHMEENFKGLVFAIDRDANRIAIETRRGRGNFVICSADVASALSLTGLLVPAIQSGINESDPTGTTFVGTFRGYDVYVDPYVSVDFYVVGYKGKGSSAPYDAGCYFAPYIALQMVKATDPSSFQPALGFKSRWGFCANPFASLSANSNVYYRKAKVLNLL